MVDDVLPADFALNDIGSDDIHDVVANVKQFYEILKLLLNQVLLLGVQLLRNVGSEVQPNELASRGNSEKVGCDFVDAPVALREFGDCPILPKPLALVCYEGDVVVVVLVRDISKERC